MNIVELGLRKSLNLSWKSLRVDLVFELEVEVVDLVRNHLSQAGDSLLDVQSDFHVVQSVQVDEINVFLNDLLSLSLLNQVQVVAQITHSQAWLLVEALLEKVPS